jgi:putative ABC transport system permease protein
VIALSVLAASVGLIRSEAARDLRTLTATGASATAMFGDVPLADVLILLIGLPLIAAVAGWLLAGRELPLIARQPIE